MALTDLTRISTSGIATGSSLSGAILHGDAHFRGTQVGVTSALFDSSDDALEFNDNVKLTFGNSGNLQLYYDNSSYITNGTAGHLFIKTLNGGSDIRLESNDDIFLMTAAGSRNSIICRDYAQVELYHDNQKKFSTDKHGSIVTGILTATSFSGPILSSPINNPSGISTFYDLRVSNNLTVEGTTTTLDTDLTAVDRVEVGADSDTIVGVAITQSGTADILKLVGSTDAVTIKKNGRIGINTTDASHLFTVFAQSGNSVLARFKALNGISNFDIFTDGSSHGQALVRNNIGETRVKLNSVGDSYFTGGDVGIGTNNPLSGTHISDGTSYGAPQNSSRKATLTISAGSEGSADIQLLSANYNHIFFGDAADPNTGIIHYEHTGGGTDDMVFSTAGSQRLRIDNNGRVGIGTNLYSPSYKLDIREASGTPYSASGTNAALAIGNINSSANTNSSGIYMYSDGNGRGVVNLNCLNNSTSSSADFTIQTRHSGTLYERFRIMSNGDTVWNGTGTATPGVGNATVGMGFEPRNGTIFLSRGDNATLLSNRNNDGRHIHFAQGGSQKFAIGLQSSGADLTFNSGGGVSPIERVRFASNGTVGIGGTTIPGALLDLSADVPSILFSETGVSANNGKWLNAANGSELYWQAQTDAHSGGGNLFKMTRSNQEIHSFEAQQAGVSWFSIRNTDKKVGIGTYAPSETLHVMGSAKFTNAGLQTHFRSTTTQFDVRQTNYDGWTHMTYPTHPIIKWNWMSGPGDHLYLASGGNTGVSTQMAMLISDSHGVKIGRSGWDGGNGTDLGTEYVRINTSGRVDIASNNYSSGHVDTKLRVGTESGSNQATVVIGSADQDVPALIITNWDGSATTNKNVIRFDNSGRGTYEIGGVGGSNEFGIFIDNFTTPKLKINSSGNATITDGNLVIGTSGHGIDFSATGDPGGMASELLDDYEEGSWTPDPNFATTGSADETALPDGGIQGQYVKIGRLVYYTFSINFQSRDSNASGNFYVSGLPYSVSNTYWNEESGFPSAYYSGITNATSQPSTQPSASGRLYFAMTDGTGNHSGNTYLNHNHIGTGHVRIRGGGIYRTAT